MFFCACVTIALRVCRMARKPISQSPPHDVSRVLVFKVRMRLYKIHREFRDLANRNAVCRTKIYFSVQVFVDSFD